MLSHANAPHTKAQGKTQQLANGSKGKSLGEPLNVEAKVGGRAP